MKICYVSDNFGITDNKFLLKLHERDYDVHAVSLRKTEISKEFKISGIKFYEYCKIQRFYGKRTKGLNPFWYVSAFRFLKRIISKIKPDILHGGYASISGFICALSNFHPFLLMPWGSDILIEPKKSILKKQLVSYAIKNSDMITCDAESVKKEIIDLFKYDRDKIIVFPRGLDLNIFNPSKKSNILDNLGWKNSLVVICTRQHKKIYGIEYLIAGIPRVITKFDNVRFMFIGIGPLTNIYKRRIKNLGLLKYVKFLGFVPNNFLPYYLNAADVYVSPSLSDGTSICLLEAMACRLPVVVTDIEANLEWVENGYNGLICSKRNSEDLADKISFILENAKLRKEMGHRNYEIVKERADWGKNFLKLEEIYIKLTKNKDQ